MGLLKSLMVFCAAVLSSMAWAQGGPVAFNFDGVLMDPNNAPVTQASVGFKVEILDAQGSCVLYSEEHLNRDLSTSAGAFSLTVGTGTSKVNNLLGSAVLSPAVFSNPGPVSSFAGCASGVTLSPGSGRLLRISFNLGSGYTAFPDFPLSSVPYATVAETLGGRRATDFVQTRSDAAVVLTQANVESVFSSTNYPRLTSLLNGVSDIAYQGARISNLPAPTAAGDATNKTYVDSNVGGKFVDMTSVGPGVGGGNTLIWDSVANKWMAGSPPVGITGLTGDVSASGSGTVSVAILPSAITTPKIANGAIISAKIAPGFNSNRLLITNGSGGDTVSYSSCGNEGEILRWSMALGWQCSPGPGAAPVTSVAGRSGAVSLAAADVGGLGSAALKNVGVGAGNVLELDVASRLPAVDGSLLTNLSAQRLQGRAIPTAVPSTGNVLVWNNTQWDYAPMVWGPAPGSNSIVASTMGSERMRLADNGFVGIGTTTPTALLSVQRSAATPDAGPATQSVSSSLMVMGAMAFSNVIGSESVIKLDSSLTGSLGNVAGSKGVVMNFSPNNGTAPNVGVDGRVIQNSTTGTLGYGIGLAGTVENNSGSLANAYGAKLSLGGTMPSGIQNGYGLYVGPIFGTISRYSIFAADSAAKVYLAGDVGVGTTSPVARLEVAGRLAATSLMGKNPSGTPVTATLMSPALQNMGTPSLNVTGSHLAGLISLVVGNTAGSNVSGVLIKLNFASGVYLTAPVCTITPANQMTAQLGTQASGYFVSSSITDMQISVAGGISSVAAGTPFSWNYICIQ